MSREATSTCRHLLPALSFRAKLFLAMIGVVVGVTGATLYLTQTRIEATQRRAFEQLSRARINYFNALQENRLKIAIARNQDFVRGVRLRALMRRVGMAAENNDTNDLAVAAENVYRTTLNQLELNAQSSAVEMPVFYRVLDARGQALAPPAGIEAGLDDPQGRRRLQNQLTVIATSLTNEAPQYVYLAVMAEPGRLQPAVVLFMPIIDESDGNRLGAVAVGYSLPDFDSPRRDLPAAEPSQARLKSGLWLEDVLFSPALLGSARASAARLLRLESGGGARAQGDFNLNLEAEPFRAFYASLNPAASLPPAYQVCFYSLLESQRERRRFFWAIIGFNGLGLLGAFLISWLLAHGLSGPVQDLVAGTAAIQEGNFAVRVPVRSRDEMGRLTAAFNGMAEGLALKEKYRSVLNLVTDRAVAQELISGKVVLGGETRNISVLFCDIRGFTALTQNMDPAEVIRLLNEHMTVLTRVVYEFHGVVDKFVGDLIMAVFGAPKRYGHEPAQAVQCARKMIAERRALNHCSRYQINIGIGIASGPAVAGCMGSQDRLNYTVLGERVNLASRLCSKAAPMEIIIDQSTRQELAGAIQVTPLEPLILKGFSQPVPAYQFLELAAEVGADTRLLGESPPAELLGIEVASRGP